MKLLSVKDRIKLTHKTEDSTVEIIVKPLTNSQKIEIQSQTKMAKGEEVQDLIKQAFLAIKYSVVSISGLTHFDESEFSLSLDDNGTLSDESADDLLSLFQNENLLTPIYQAASRSIKEIKGVEVQVLPKK